MHKIDNSFCCLPYKRLIAYSEACNPLGAIKCFFKISSILSFPYGNPVAAYVFFFVFTPLLSFPLFSFNNVF